MHFIISILPLTAALFWLFVMILDKQKGYRKALLITLFAHTTVIYFTHAVFFNHYYELYRILDSFWVFSTLMVYPIFYIYIRILTTEDRLGWHWIWFSLPAFLIALMSGLMNIMMTPEEADAYIRGYMYKQPGFETDSVLVELQVLKQYVVQIFFFMQVVSALIVGMILIIRYNNRLKQYYSDINGRDMTSIKWLLIAFVLMSLFSVISNFLSKTYFIVHPSFLVAPSLIFAIVISFTGYFLYRQRFGIENLLTEAKHSGVDAEQLDRIMDFLKKDSDSLNIPEDAPLKTKIKHLLEKHKVYRYQDLRVNDFSALLDSNRTYVSRVINEEFNSNFSDLINGHRVEYAKKLLSTDNEMVSSMSDIASLSGFSSESSFYRVFKSSTGLSPGQYRKKAEVEIVDKK